MGVKFGLAPKLARYPVNGKKRSLRQIAAEIEAKGYSASGRKPFGASAIARMVDTKRTGAAA
jgi:hypothetical protein